MESFRRLFGIGDLQCAHFTDYFNGRQINREEYVHYSRIGERFANGEKYGLITENIQRICVYRHGAGESRDYHAFVVLKTEQYYYSIERWCKYVAINRSNVLIDVVENCHKDKRGGNVERETDWFEGKGTVWQVFQFIVAKKFLEQKFNILFRNCQVFASEIFKNFNNEGLKFRKYRKIQTIFPLHRAAGYWNLQRFTMFSA